jgi:hypothetical protein
MQRNGTKTMQIVFLKEAVALRAERTISLIMATLLCRNYRRWLAVNCRFQLPTRSRTAPTSANGRGRAPARTARTPPCADAAGRGRAPARTARTPPRADAAKRPGRLVVPRKARGRRRHRHTEVVADAYVLSARPEQPVQMRSNLGRMHGPTQP